MGEIQAGARPDLSDSFDILIVGGGAVGCAVAWEAASRELRTALLERDDFGGATSANSLRIIHGGLRYLQSLDLARARASAKERAIFMQSAHNLVSPLQFVAPTLRSVKRGRLAYAAGLGVNRLLSIGLGSISDTNGQACANRLIAKSTLLNHAPGLATRHVTGGAQWFDGGMSSGERLALAFALSAKRRGARILNHVEVLSAVTDGGRITGVASRDRLTGENLEMHGRVVVDCRGGDVAAQPGLLGDLDSNVAFCKAVNIIIGGREIKCAVGAPLRDIDGNPGPGRLIFARPLDQETVVGTWYFPCPSSSDALSRSEVQAILLDVNGAFPGWQVTSSDVLGTHIGFIPRSLRIASDTSPIDHPLLVSAEAAGGPKGLWHAQTEKWTTVRLLAERLVDQLARIEHLKAAPSQTAILPLYGGGPVSLAPNQSEVLSKLGPEQSTRMQSHYGDRLGQVLDYIIADATLALPIPSAPAFLQAELRYTLDHEQVRTPKDVANRLAPGTIKPLDNDSIAFIKNFMQVP